MMRALVLVPLAAMLFGCSTTPRVLIVRSEPADAAVCIKGKAHSGHFGEEKTCVGTTPFEADRVELPQPDGGKRIVKFKDVASDKESFYVLVSRPGYLTQALEIPEWEHLVLLKTEPPLIPGGSTAPEAEGEPPPIVKGSFRLGSDPIGALVYIDGELRGNTPFAYESLPGPGRVRVELEGYRAVEKVITILSGEILRVSFKLLTLKEAAAQDADAKPIESAPIEAKQSGPAPTDSAAKGAKAAPKKPKNKAEELGF